MSTLENAEMGIDEIRERVEGLLKRHKVASEKRSTYKGLLEAKKEELSNLKREIEAAGLDPSKLKERKEALQADLLRMIEDFDKQLTSVEQAFASFERK